MSGYEVTWNGVSSTTIPQLICGRITRKLLGGHRGSFVEIPGRDGSTYFPEERGRREITIECAILEPDVAFPAGRRDAVTLVADWLDVNRQCKLILGDATGVYYNAVLAEPPDVDEWREAGIFDLTFLAEPYAYGTAVTTNTLALTSGVADNEDFGVNLPVFPVIEITPTNGASITGFTLTVGENTLTYNTLLATGDTVTINAIAMSVLAGSSNDTYLTGAYDPIDLVMAGVTGTFPILMPDFQDVTITKLGGTATTFSVKFYYRNRYRN